MADSFIKTFSSISAANSGLASLETGQIFAVKHDLYRKTGSSTFVTITGAPTGSILPFAGSSIPEGYLECNGQAVSRTTFANLYSAIGTTWGSGNGSTTFNVPDLRECTLVGTGSNGLSPTDTYSLGTFKDDTQPSLQGTGIGVFTGNFQTPSGTGSFVRTSTGNEGNPGGSANGTTSYTFDASRSARAGTVTRGKQLGCYFIIKAY